MRETGPIHKKFAKGGERYAPLARTMLGALKKRLALNRLKEGVDRKTLPDGTEITVKVLGGQEIVEVTPPKGGKEEETKCAKLLSGFRNGLSPTVFTKSNGTYYYPTKQLQGIADEGFYLSSSNFTGMMAVVAEYFMGLKGSSKLFEFGNLEGLCAYWSKTHGIYIQQKNEKSPKIPWIICVDASGVYCRKLRLCKGTGLTLDQKEFRNKFGFIPELPNYGFLRLGKGWIQLADEVEVSEFFSGGSLYTACGWAFNSKGTRAVNTSVQFVTISGKSGWKFSEFELDIETDSDGYPIGAGVTLVDSGIARYGWTGAEPAPARLIVPRDDGLLQKFDFSINRSESELLGSEGERAPVYSFFDESDVKVKFVHINKVVTTSQDVTEWANNKDKPASIGYSRFDDGHRYDGYVGGVYPLGTSQLPFRDFTGNSVEVWLHQFDHAVYKSGQAIGLHGLDNGALFEIQHKYTYWSEGGQQSYNLCGIIPTGDRAAFYWYKLDVQVLRETITSDSTWASYDHGWIRANQDNDPGGKLVLFYMYHTYCPVQGSGNTCNGVYDPSDGAYAGSALSESSSVTTSHVIANKDGRESGWVPGEALKLEPFDPSVVETRCTGYPDPSYVYGWCYSQATSPMSEVFPDYYATPESYTHTRTEELTLYNVSGSQIVYSDVETTNSDSYTFTRVLTPGEGNHYCFMYFNGQRMYHVTDYVTSGFMYSLRMFGDSGTGIRLISTGPYAASSISSSVMHSWLGIPGDL